MSLELILGPMFSGKTSYLLDKSKQAKLSQIPYICVNHTADKRYNTSGAIHSHDDICDQNTLSVSNLIHVLENKKFIDARLILIDEGQFYTDLREFILIAVDALQKNVVVVGLDGDAERRMFDPIRDVLPLADDIRKLKSFCSSCHDNTHAIFTIKKSGCRKSQIDVGGIEKYTSVCRKHFI